MQSQIILLQSPEFLPFIRFAQVIRLGQHTAGFCVWATVIGLLFLVRTGQLCYTSGKLFREQFDAGYHWQTQLLAPAPFTDEELAELDAEWASIEPAQESTEEASVEPEFVELGEWWVNAKGNPYTRKSDLSRAYRKVVNKFQCAS